ncbi:MAG: nucleotide exchange factor GrpE [Actinobacteria bacterium]|nr:nucleotide exchange factor GrpE [Actinomycetota bacterium]
MTSHHKKPAASHRNEPGAFADRKNRDKNAGAHSDNAAEAQELAEITAELHEEVLRERDEYLDSLQRLKAEFENFRKRMQREGEQRAQRAQTEVIEELLPVLDNFERAMQAAAQHDEKLLTSGVELVYNQLRDLLTRRGLCEIESEGAQFDPNQHDAVMCQPSGEHEEGTVMQVLEKGYQLDDKVMRPAKVIVSAAPEDDGGKKQP